MAEVLRPINPNPGSERDQRNFVGRADTTRRAEQMLRAGQNILISDPRRMGKTFWMQTIATRPEFKGNYRVLFIDYQGVNSTEEFLTKTAAELAGSSSLPQKFHSRLKAVFDGVDTSVSLFGIQLKAAVRKSAKGPAEIMEELLIHLDNDLSEDVAALPVVIAMDEVPDAVMEIARCGAAGEAHNLLKRLRHLRGTTKKIRWIVAGSIGFHHVLTAAGASTDVLNNLDPLEFGPLAQADAVELAQRLALGIQRPISAEAVARVVEMTDAIPSLVQKLFDMMQYDQNRQSAAGSQINAGEVAERLEDFINDRDKSRDVTHFVTRVDLYYGQDVALAWQILDYMAGAADWTPFTSLEESMTTALGSEFDRKRFVTTYNNLCDDHYLAEREADGQSEVAWRYPVIRTIYRRRQKLG